MPFEMTIDGTVYNSDDLTLGEACELEAELGETWGRLSPLRSAAGCRAFAQAFLTRRHGPDEAAKLAGEMPLGEALKAVRWVDNPDDTEAAQVA